MTIDDDFNIGTPIRLRYEGPGDQVFLCAGVLIRKDEHFLVVRDQKTRLHIGVRRDKILSWEAAK
ncbi:hypothetical protein GOV10_02960 [Candidatus Woesearchaeota archaeon]|nr:hypothetical protein [Candidatus Woesearchaeota archaeon]